MRQTITIGKNDSKLKVGVDYKTSYYFIFTESNCEIKICECDFCVYKRTMDLL